MKQNCLLQARAFISCKPHKKVVLQNTLGHLRLLLTIKLVKQSVIQMTTVLIRKPKTRLQKIFEKGLFSFQNMNGWTNHKSSNSGLKSQVLSYHFEIWDQSGPVFKSFCYETICLVKSHSQDTVANAGKRSLLPYVSFVLSQAVIHCH